MATATQTQTKTGFVTEFLSDHPDSNVGAVNKAWQAAGNKGTIADSLIYDMKAQMREGGKSRTAKTSPRKTTTAAKSKPATKMSKTGTTPGKALFVKELLIDHPQSNVKMVNEAWAAAGMKGSISETVVNKMRSRLGLAGNLRAKPTASTTGQRGVLPRVANARVDKKPVEQPRSKNNDRASALLNVEAEIDQMLFKLMGLGDLAEIESALRTARRLIYGAMDS